MPSVAERPLVRHLPLQTLRLLVTLRDTWSLLVGMALLMVGHGLQATLLGVRASLEDFPAVVTGMVMSGYYAGLLVGSFAVPKLVARTGHVRVFAALLSLGSTTILFHALLVEPVAWFAMRVLAGFCLAGAFICAESWLNAATNNANRGSLLSIYMVVQMGAYALGQFLLVTADPRGFALFMAVSVLISVAAVPMLLAATHAPPIRTPRPVGLRYLYKVSPLGVIGLLGVGLSHSALYAIGPVFAREAGLSLAAISTFMAVVVMGGVVFQWPIGRLSDHFDRRQVIAVVTTLTAIVAVAGLLGGGVGLTALFVQFFLIGGLALPLYALCAAHTNDFLSPQEMVGASSSILLAYGLGAALGPTLVSIAMAGIGIRGFLVFLVVVHTVIGAFAVFRMTRRPTVPVEERGPVLAIQTQAPVMSGMTEELRVARSS